MVVAVIAPEANLAEVMAEDAMPVALIQLVGMVGRVIAAVTLPTEPDRLPVKLTVVAAFDPAMKMPPAAPAVALGR